MRDTSVPSFLIPQDGQSINLTITGTDALLEDQGYTYNQVGMTYNQVGVFYGGVYNADEDIIPILASAHIISPSLEILLDSISLRISQTQALLADQGYTYNQLGLTYNQVGVLYGGVYHQDQDVLPLSLSFADIYTPFTPPGQNQSVGPGFFMFITH